MRGTEPAPMVPELPADSRSESETGLAADGGEHRDLPERTFGAPLVPDCS